MVSFSFNVALFCLGTVGLAKSVLIGDEQYGDIAGGRFWAFHSEGISIVNYDTCEVERTFKKGLNGDRLPSQWKDGVYMETQMGNEGLVLINSGVTKSDGHENPGGGTGEVFVISTNPADYESPVKAVVEVGGRPVHSYGVYTRNQFWTHSDETGEFFVINLDDFDEHTGKPVLAKVVVANHGKLLWDEGLQLRQHGFATSTGERILFVLDMEQQEQLLAFNYSSFLDSPDPNYCKGLHAIAWSSLNNHIYAECSGGGGILEFDVSYPENPDFVHHHTEATGALYETPNGDAVVASDKGGNKLHIFKPNGTGQQSSIMYVVNVPGHPSSPSFFPMGESYMACMSLTENTNRNNKDANGNLVCDYYGCSGAETPDDVASGICLHDATERILQSATLDEISLVKAESEPFGSACRRCKDKGNFDEDGTCICTPFCGSCADPNYDASDSGVRCVNLQDVFEKQSVETFLIKGAGAVKQGNPYSYSPQCGFGRTYRKSKRGHKYDASVAHIPTNSLQIVNMETQKHKCQVPLPGSPDRVVYVPPQPGQKSSSQAAGLSTGAIVGIVVGCVAIAGIAFYFMARKGNNKDSQPIDTAVDVKNDIS